MAYQSKCPSLAAGGTLVKRNGKRIRRDAETGTLVASTPTETPSRPTEPEGEVTIPTEWFMENWGLNDWNERGWHGGGQIPIRNLKQKTRPSKARHHTTRKAHPSLLKVR